ncbi:hypothetical protein JOQ06_028884 [Pogonophryne albipinna]|uniref:CS domain-containing protein n=1 Tax=Pogonophryne albipinna TaxID=1090488 RepID=A0AAD6FL51_9TELE|nr:hypothetical protein JOQ06_028884 [Pogonophryne albipinna]
MIPAVSDKSFEVWIKQCEEMMGEQISSGDDMTPAAPPVKHDWYQTESQVIVTVMAKNVPKDGVCVNYMERELSAMMKLASGENYNLELHLLHSIIPQQSNFKILTTKDQGFVFRGIDHAACQYWKALPLH